jgi:dGTPase
MSYVHLKKFTSSIIGRFSVAAQAATREKYGDGALSRYSAHLIIPRDTKAEIELLKAISVTYVMQPREATKAVERERNIIYELVDLLMSNSPKQSPIFDTLFIEDWQNASNENERLRIAIDQVASLTNNTAKSLLNQLLV